MYLWRDEGVCCVLVEDEGVLVYLWRDEGVCWCTCGGMRVCAGVLVEDVCWCTCGGMRVCAGVLVEG